MEKAIGRTLYLYLHEDVSDDSCQPLIEQIQMANDNTYMTAEEHVNGSVKRSDDIEKIVLSINSAGGYVSSGMSLVNVIEASKIPVEAEIHFGASMACIIAVSCHKRRIYKRGSLMWHNISSGLQGDHESLKEVMKQIEVDKLQADKIILDRTNLTEKELKSIYRTKKDRVYYSSECIERGMVDEII